MSTDSSEPIAGSDVTDAEPVTASLLQINISISSTGLLFTEQTPLTSIKVRIDELAEVLLQMASLFTFK